MYIYHHVADFLWYINKVGQYEPRSGCPPGTPRSMWRIRCFANWVYGTSLSLVWMVVWLAFSHARCRQVWLVGILFFFVRWREGEQQKRAPGCFVFLWLRCCLRTCFFGLWMLGRLILSSLYLSWTGAVLSLWSVLVWREWCWWVTDKCFFWYTCECIHDWKEVKTQLLEIRLQ